YKSKASGRCCSRKTPPPGGSAMTPTRDCLLRWVDGMTYNRRHLSDFVTPRGPAHVVRRVRHTLARSVKGRRPGGGAAVVGTVLPPTRGPGPQEAAQRPAPRRRRGGRGPERLRQLLPQRRAGAVPQVTGPRQLAAPPGRVHGPQVGAPAARRRPPEA